MIKIHPEIDFNAVCPADGEPLRTNGVVIPGMRALADCSCEACGANYYVDLPISHTLWSPIYLNQFTATIHDPARLNWFSEPLKEGFLEPENRHIVPTVQKFFQSDSIVLVNCLDFLYGHSLLKLLNVQRHLDQDPQLGCCVLVPQNLAHLVPAGVAEIWEFPEPLQSGRKWYSSLAKWISDELSSRKECFLSRAYSHPSNRFYNLRRFVRNLPDVSEDLSGHSPVILFSYREDRLWGANIRRQEINLQALYELLTVTFTEIAFVLVGFGSENNLKFRGGRIIDLRCKSFHRDRDRLWLAFMNASDCCVGVHGSNMLLPSGLAKSTVELLPRTRECNMLQDILFPPGFCDIREALLAYRFIHGNETLSDVAPQSVAEAVSFMVTLRSQLLWWLNMGDDDGPLSPPPMDPETFKKICEQRIASSTRPDIRNSSIYVTCRNAMKLISGGEWGLAWSKLVKKLNRRRDQTEI